MDIVIGSVNVEIPIRLLGEDGLPMIGVAHDDVDLWYRRSGGADTPIVLLVEDWGESGDGYYSAVVPDAAALAGADWVQFGGSVTGGVMFAPVANLITPRLTTDQVASPAQVTAAADSVVSQGNSAGWGAVTPAAPDASTVAGAVRTELAAELGRIDQPISSRLQGSAYTAPDNAGIAAIKSQADKLDFSGDAGALKSESTNMRGTDGAITSLAGVATPGDIPDAISIASAVWSSGARTLTGWGTLVADVASAVWASAARTLTAFEFSPSLDPAYDAAKTAAQADDVTAALTEMSGDGFDSETDALSKLRAAIDAIEGGGGEGGATAEEIWTYPDRELTGGGGDGSLTPQQAAQLAAIEERTRLGVRVSVGTHVAADGETLSLVQGESYLEAIGNAVEIQIDDERLEGTGYTPTLILSGGVCGVGSIAIQGVAKGYSNGTLALSFDIPKETPLISGKGFYSVSLQVGENPAHVVIPISRSPLFIRPA